MVMVRETFGNFVHSAVTVTEVIQNVQYFNQSANEANFVVKAARVCRVGLVSLALACELTVSFLPIAQHVSLMIKTVEIVVRTMNVAVQMFIGFFNCSFTCGDIFHYVSQCILLPLGYLIRSTLSRELLTTPSSSLREQIFESNVFIVNCNAYAPRH